MTFITWTCVIFLCIASQTVVGDEGAIEPRSPEWSGASAGMDALYKMQNGFLNDLIQTKTIGQLLVSYDIQTFSDLGDDAFLDMWTEWIMYAIGYAVCIGIGVLFMFILPCTGCGISCCRTCRCCKCCCGKAPRFKNEMSKWECKRIGFGTTMAVLTAFLFASVICAYVACGQLHTQIGPYGFLDTILKGLYTIDDYVVSTSNELDTELLVPIDDSLDQLNDTVANFPQLIVAGLGRSVGMVPDLAYLQQFANNLNSLVGNLTIVSGGRSILQTQASTLDSDLAAEHSHLTGALSQCLGTVSLCQDLSNRIPDLKISTDYNGLQNMTTEISAIDDAATDAVITEINTNANLFWNISIPVEMALGSILADIQESLGSFEEGVTDSIQEMQDALEGISLNDTEKAIWEVKPIVHEYGSYAYWGLIGIMSMCTLIVLCYMAGIIIGLVLPSPSRDTDDCSPTSKLGSSFLLAGIGLTLIFSWLLMLLIIIFFATGGIIENNICRHLVVYDDSMDQLETLFMNEINADYNISIKESMLACKQNQSLYIAASLEQNGVNITKVVDLSQYGLYDMLDYLRNASIPFIPPPPIISPAINDSMLTISNELDSLEPKLGTYGTELTKPITVTDLPLYIEDLKQLKPMVTNPTSIQTEIDHLTGIHDGSYSTLSDERDRMQSALDIANTIIGMFELPEGLTRLTEADKELATNGAASMKKAQDEMADSLQVLMEKLSKDVEQAVRFNIGRCRVLFDAGTSMVDGACVYFLMPYNALWFCIGWFMIFSILAVGFGNELAYIFSAEGKSHKIGTEMETLDLPEKEEPPVYSTRPSPPSHWNNQVSPHDG